MDTETSLKSVSDLLQTWAVETQTPESNRLDIVIRPQDLPAAVSALVDAHWGYLTAITGMDHPTPAQPAGEAGETLEFLYHFAKKAAVLTLRVSVPVDRATLPSVCKWIPTATLYERELIEMFGVSIPDTPNKDRFLLADDWPDGIYPLRKSFSGSANLDNA